MLKLGWKDEVEMQIQFPSLSTANVIATGALKLAITVWLLLAVAALFVMSLGTDEAWVLNGLRSSLNPQVDNLSTELIVTSGGLFALLNLAVEWTAGSVVWMHRLLSIVALGVTFALVMRRIHSAGLPKSVQWLTLTPLMAVPGTIEVGTAALGTSIGLLLMVASMLVWSAPAIPLVKRVITGGLLFGLAAASRFDLVLFGFIVLLVSCVNVLPNARIKLRLSLAACAFLMFGMGVFFFNQWAMSHQANAMVAANIGGATGLGGWVFNYPKTLNQWLTLTSYAPVSLLGLLLLGAFWSTSKSGNELRPEVPKFKTLLAVTGVALLTAWLFRAPIAHLRYAFPALFCFAILGAIGLQRLAEQSLSLRSERHWLLCQCLGLSLVVGSIGSTARSLIMSDSDYASWEWTHEMPYDYFRRFEAQQHQREIAEFLRTELSPDARLYSHVPYVLRYLTKRPIVAIDVLQKSELVTPYSNRYIVITPATGTYFYLNNATANWLLLNTKLIKQIGRYSVYELPAGNDSDLEIMKLGRTNYEKHPGSLPWFGR